MHQQGGDMANQLKYKRDQIYFIVQRAKAGFNRSELCKVFQISSERLNAWEIDVDQGKLMSPIDIQFQDDFASLGCIPFSEEELGSLNQKSLAQIEEEVKSEAIEFCFETNVVGDLLKFPSKVFLELSIGRFNIYPRIYKHRNHGLTKEFFGERVSINWILRFLEYHSKEAGQLVEAQPHSEVSQRSPIRPNIGPSSPCNSASEQVPKTVRYSSSKVLGGLEVGAVPLTYDRALGVFRAQTGSFDEIGFC
jgi:DNA-binding XRE family transcriptional regulator